jgi:CRISPR-associated protein Cas1
MKQLIVDTQGVMLHKRGERLSIEQEGETLQSVPLGSLEQLVVMGRGVHVSTPLLYDLARREVDVVYQSTGGRFGFRVVGPLSNHSALRVAQVITAGDPDRAVPIVRQIVSGKLHNQAVLLSRYEGTDRAIDIIRAQIDSVQGAASVDSARGYEGSGAAAYFAGLRTLFDAGRWGFEGRDYYPPPDPVNAMLSFGYTLLLNDITGALYRIGLDPMIGFLHAIDYGRPSLALDMEEEFRPIIVDTLVLGFLRNNLLEPADFEVQERKNGRYLLMTDDARRFYLERYEERLSVRVRHPMWDQQLTYRQCIQRQAEHMARCITGQDPLYQPLLIG